EKTPVCNGFSLVNTSTTLPFSYTQVNGVGGNFWSCRPSFPPANLSGSPPVLYNFAGEVGWARNNALATTGNPQLLPLTYNNQTYQSQPQQGACDPQMAQTPHAGGTNVAMFDGSVKFVSNSVSYQTWQAEMTPSPSPTLGISRTDIVGGDFND